MPVSRALRPTQYAPGSVKRPILVDLLGNEDVALETALIPLAQAHNNQGEHLPLRPVSPAHEHNSQGPHPPPHPSQRLIPLCANPTTVGSRIYHYSRTRRIDCVNVYIYQGFCCNNARRVNYTKL
ncbi:hypothetical protein FRC12_001013 [Ceratobasidium sp. 428]|nr:hypothetical protein FRC12_001013 [Ceratobasidium sp. 428]